MSEPGQEQAERCAAVLAASFPKGGSWSADEIREALSRPGAFLFEDRGGFLIVKAVLDEAEIWTLAVPPDARRQGIAAALLAHAQVVLTQNGVKRLFLEVARDNEAARALYASAGFNQIAERKGYYRGGVDALILEKRLPLG